MDFDVFCFYYYYNIVNGCIEFCKEFLKNLNGEFNFFKVKNCIIDKFMVDFGFVVWSYEFVMVGE